MESGVGRYNKVASQSFLIGMRCKESEMVAKKFEGAAGQEGWVVSSE